MPVAHALVQVREDLERTVEGLETVQVWARPGGAASIGFHLRHIAGVLDRLLYHAAEHATHHTRQIMTTAKVL